MRARLTLSGLLALALFGLSARSAHAADIECSSNADCVKGWTCETSASNGCAAPTCAPGEKCDEPIDCVSTEYKACVPAPCRADSECADGMVCYTHTESNCTAIPCAPGVDCPAPSCEPETRSACVPRYLLPCTKAADCGAGFRCEASEECTCSGGSGSNGSGNGDSASDGSTPAPMPTPTPEESCTCTPSKELHCAAPHVQCTADSECTNGWTCAAVGATTDCQSAPPVEPGSSAGAAPVPDCQPSATIKECVPPYYAVAGTIQGVTRDSSGSPTLGASEGTAGGTPPQANSGSDAASSSGGCSVAKGARSDAAGALLVALGLAFGLRRRRAR